MSIVSEEIYKMTEYAGGVRSLFRFVFTDGREVVLGTRRAADEAGLLALMPKMRAKALASQKLNDSILGAREGNTAGYGEATQDDMVARYIQLGLYAQTTKDAYRALKKIDNVLESAQTDEFIATKIGILAKHVNKARLRWAQLKPSGSIIEAYLGLPNA